MKAEALTSSRNGAIAPGQRAYLARWEGHTLGPSGASPRWEDLQPCAQESWARVERACFVPDGYPAEARAYAEELWGADWTANEWGSLVAFAALMTQQGGGDA